jgi:hypothetical protein
MADVQGICDARFEPVRDALAGQLECGHETGASITVDVDARTTISYMMNKTAPGIIGSDRSETYVRAIHDCLA